MTKDFSRRFVLSGLIAAASGPAFADAPLRSLRPAVRPGVIQRAAGPSADRLVRAAELGTGRVGYVVADAHTGQMLETMNPLLPLPPASVAKAITTLYALDRLGAGYRFRTRLYATGPIRNGKLEGDLILVGGGDPVLNTDMLGNMARDLKAAGVNEITGQFRVHSAALPYVRAIDASQPEHLGYNPSVSGLNLNFNRVHFEWKRQSDEYEVIMDARAERFRPRVHVSSMQVVNRSYPVYTYTDTQGSDSWTVARGALGNGGSRWLPVRKPELYAAEVFQTLARSHGIVLPRARTIASTTTGTIVVEHSSTELRLILRNMLKYSTNLTAEAVGMTASSVSGGRVHSLRGSAREMAAWLTENLGANRARFVDHSGLGDESQLSARDMVRMLLKTGPESALRPMMKDIAIRDNQGRVVRNHAISVKAKTGTLNFVSSLAGYARTPRGRDLAFAIFTADTDRRAQVSPPEREVPPGARSWKGRSRRLQQQLIRRWADRYER
ncbi:D-alanyl-D-alanine carboxypeptidase/D-alanyl-D-alanine-endopeptidase [Pseudohalocynthiibacter aestuariivivens]|jgi:serine-type D-Ala-D-Ala carboxypeptidase/endopeptidase (penicillin-binding protein 4)|uniref:D-alanyl-D-alanine carboxypeptidase/D-alanyl-D-alanine-endopeptidase n=1 Tax=Pseudohalocynthiibacter aestuariivivens TaxID=1591409 RepID=A0ABV5JH32_9RHOB|nr:MULTISPECIES: D-alanyl-D-alanine carboxypeptidase/D-alanyl-D-alanine-endopeptidase [Pseudohalocynthiibacter]MBS9718455.1 D-alanyl-D-alanine carboxypeptidase/D-alanyl-D-alanine-endopeptidase [Pseudohalocynthiibacter aestuariivivens]MCK0104076.1 D-alanyl-D-alanine carboxypeptidase/D-alanyl-D-alanine-endopeptidase [Pseudohalocynthiibacter sp. F2068]